ncbi:VOC family protein [Novosphingobium flavum]|uniref:VOC family protein n=1 Tax=Novosphingobium flavum TaxID=1778672 RepID=A0A7X1FP39_9SPHN|nr:VOC family protein [Novosphingobium flavum]MBC2664268.1 VOC family protein [Novosphingobium flavum]
MGNPVGSFIWYELMTTDADAASSFYGAVIGWSVSPKDPAAPLDYRFIGRADGGMNGGILQLSDDMAAHGARPAWVPYLYVTDVDQAVTAILDDGGKVLMPKNTIPQGSFAMVTDPQGVPFYVMTPAPPPGKPEAKSDVFSVTEPQHVRWNELASPDLEGAKAFYAFHFGFEFNNSMPMGPMGDYCFIDHHGQTLGAIMQQQPEQPPLWLPYIGVASTSAARLAIEENGGTVLRGPMEVPGGDWIVIATDPAGAVFGVVGPKGD